MANNETWYGYSREEYYELVKQPNDPEWEDLEQIDIK
jgi:hypothetical protein